MKNYNHLAFQKTWTLTEKINYLLGQLNVSVKHLCEMPLNPDDYEKLLRVQLIKGAQATTAIEGNTLSEEEVGLVAEGKSLPPSKKYQEIEVKNILDAFNELLREVTAEQTTQKITPDLLLRFHQMIGKELGPHFDAYPGRFRNDERVVGGYKCPPYREVPDLVNSYCEWLSREFGYTHGNHNFSDGVIEAIVAHIYLEWIHPFGDGNGRTGRLIEFYILLRIGVPNVASVILSNHYNSTRTEYYREISNAAAKNDLTEFIEYSLTGFKDGLDEVLQVASDRQFANAWRSHIYDVFRDLSFNKPVFKRRRELILSMPIGQTMKMKDMISSTPEVARLYASTSKRTVSRDIEVLIDNDLLKGDGNGYRANAALLRKQRPTRFPNRI